jgi:hypothetical protein
MPSWSVLALVAFHGLITKAVSDNGALPNFTEIGHFRIDNLCPCILPKPVKKPPANFLHNTAA